MRRMAIVGSVFLLGLWSTAPAEAGFTAWKGSDSGDWETPGNWTAGVPGKGDTAYLGSSDDGHVVKLSTSTTVDAVYGGSHFVLSSARLTLDGSSSDVTSFYRAEVFNGGEIVFAGPGHYQGGVTLGTPSNTGFLTVTGAGVNWSGAITEGAPGAGTTTIEQTGDVTVETSTVLSIATRFQNRGRLHTDVLTEIVPSPGSLPSDGAFEASLAGTLSVRPGPNSTFTLGDGASVKGQGRFEQSGVMAGGGTVRVLPGARSPRGLSGSTARRGSSWRRMRPWARRTCTVRSPTVGASARASCTRPAHHCCSARTSAAGGPCSTAR
jgi:hypothetical protein